ncbi:MAG TPA: maleylacetate reductase [Acidimicrobiales bacterium]
MEPFDYDVLPGRVIFGVGRRSEVGDEVERLTATRVVLIADAHDQETIAYIEGVLGERLVATFTEVAQHVPVALAEKLRALVASTGANATVSLGGGSATGFGKAVSLTHGLPQICIPTTYAGSELTPIWGTSSGEVKETGRDLRVLPRTVIYDPELTLGLPISIAGPSAMNALAHAVEGLYGPGANPVMSAIALESVRVLSTHLPIMKAAPASIEERSKVLYGAYLAGVVLAVVGTALHHKTCHILGGLYGLDHAKMNAVVLPHALAFNAPAIPEAYERLNTVLGGDAAGQLYDLARALDTPSSLLEIGMPADGVERAAPLVVRAAADNVRSIDLDQAVAFLTNCANGQRPS